MALKYDLPPSFYSTATLLDSNYSFSLLDPNIPDSKIFTELYVTKKGEYDFLEIGTRSDYHNSAYLYQETNFKDIGGGLMTFERKYARIPDSSYTVQTVSVPVGRLIAMTQQTPPLTSQGYSYLGVKYPTGYQEMDVDDGNGIRRVYVNSSVNADLACKVTTAYYAADIDGVEDGGVSFGNTAQIATLLPEINTGGTITSYTYWANSYLKYTYNIKGSLFPAGTIVKREPAGRYAGNIYAYKEYAIQNDFAVNFGKPALTKSIN